MLACSASFFGCSGKDIVTVDKGSSLNSSANLGRRDFAPHEGDWGQVFKGPLWVCIRRSKTNQYGARLNYVPLISIPDCALCPVSTVLSAFALSPVRTVESAPFFSVNSAGAFSPLSHRIFVRRSRDLISTIGPYLLLRSLFLVSVFALTIIQDIRFASGLPLCLFH